MFVERMSRRSFLKKAGKAALGGGLLYAVGGLVSKPKFIYAGGKKEVKGVKVPEADIWRQYAGTKLIFMSENTPPSSAIKAHLQEFYDLTGIEVDIRQDVLSTVQEKVGIDLKGGSSAYHLNYAQCKPMGTMFADYWADLNPFMEDQSLPQDPEGYGDDKWGYRWIDVCGRFYDRNRTVALPYDNAVAIMFYRKDLFEKYTKQFEKEFGYPLEYTEETTWKNLLDFMKFFNNKKIVKEVEYGFGFQGLEGWAGQLDFQRPLYSHGQWEEWHFDDPFLGTRNPGPSRWGDDQSIMTLTKMQELYKLAHPESLSWDWSGVNNAFQTGKVAMCINYGEFAATVEDPNQSVAAGGKVGYELDPKGEPSWIINGGKAVNCTNYGIGGIAINGNLKKDLQRAAWIFVVWATSAPVQKMVLKELGGTPTRMSVLTDPEVVAASKRPTTMPNALTYPPILKGIMPPHVVPGPKIPKWNEYAVIQCVEISKCMAGKQGPEETAKILKKKLDQMNGI
ncbi:MAG: extracellular solute-binding protein [Spirochaetota bacterium]